ncbi:MAG: hypothetical protein RL497_238 [Pseudomonadota bacterium]|jgi:hypothetical protein
MLYKYLPSDRIDVLESLKIRYSPLKALNDPYEIYLPINVDSETNESLQQGFDEIDAYLNTLPENEAAELKRQSFREAYKEGFKPQFNNIIASENLVESLGNSFGVLSLSRTKDSLLMWSHYASQHSGFVIGFDETKIDPHQFDRSGAKVIPSKVMYSKNIRHITFSGDSWKEMLSQKPIEWEYEQEERFFMTDMDLSRSIGLDGFSTEIVLSSLNPTSILEIFIGCRAAEETKIRIFNSVKLHALNCDIYNCSTSKEKYGLIFHKVI